MRKERKYDVYGSQWFRTVNVRIYRVFGSGSQEKVVENILRESVCDRERKKKRERERKRKRRKNVE